MHWEDLEGSGGEGGGREIGMGNTCKPMAVSFQFMTKSTTNKNIIIIIIKKKKLNGTVSVPLLMSMSGAFFVLFQCNKTL